MEDQVTIVIDSNSNIVQQIKENAPKNIDCIAVSGSKEPIAKAAIALKAENFDFGWCTWCIKASNATHKDLYY